MTYLHSSVGLRTGRPYEHVLSSSGRPVRLSCARKSHFAWPTCVLADVCVHAGSANLKYSRKRGPWLAVSRAQSANAVSTSPHMCLLICCAGKQGSQVVQASKASRCAASSPDKSRRNTNLPRIEAKGVRSRRPERWICVSAGRPRTMWAGKGLRFTSV